jgi:hypothetical protein
VLPALSRNDVPLEEIVTQLEGHFQVSVNVLAPSLAALRATLLQHFQLENPGRDNSKCPARWVRKIK